MSGEARVPAWYRTWCREEKLANAVKTHNMEEFIFVLRVLDSWGMNGKEKYEYAKRSLPDLHFGTWDALVREAEDDHGY